MAIAEINNNPYHSTGSIMVDICRNGWVKGYEIYTFSPPANKNMSEMPGHYYIGNQLAKKINNFWAEKTGLECFFNIIPTLKLLHKFDELKIDLIHFHNLRNCCICLPLFFAYIRRKKIPVVCKLAGTWIYTGECGLHSLYNCDKWITGCHDCEQLKLKENRPIFDISSLMWKMKKKWTEGINLTVVAPSEWVADCARKSFLGCHDIRVIRGGSNQYIFYPREKTNFKNKHGFEDKVMILGVSDWWGPAKGLDVMIELANRLDNSRYKVVLVGTNVYVDKLLPDSILSIHRISDKNELADIYTAADMFIMTTRAETFGNVIVEALACGTPVITFRTGGCPELVDETCGAVVEMDDVPALIEEIEKEAREHNFTSENCVKRASQFTQEKMINNYLELYSELLKKQTSEQQ